MGKQNMYDHSIRMPLLIAGPGVPRGRRVEALVYQHSLFATTCELAGVPAPPSVECSSLAGLLKGGTGEPHEITMSRTHIDRHGWDEAAHTLLHEMVHQWQAEAGLPVDHGPTFRRKAREVGVEPRAHRQVRSKGRAA